MEEDVEEYVQVEEAICMDNSTAHRLWLKFSSLASRWPNTLPNIQPDPQASIRRARLLRGRSWETLCANDYSILIKKLKKEREAAEEADAAVTGWWTKGILFLVMLTKWFQLPGSRSSSSTLSLKQNSVRPSTLSHVFPFCLANLSVK